MDPIGSDDFLFVAYSIKQQGYVVMAAREHGNVLVTPLFSYPTKEEAEEALKRIVYRLAQGWKP